MSLARNIPIAAALGIAAALATYVALADQPGALNLDTGGCALDTGRLVQSSWRITWPGATGDLIVSSSRPSAAPVVTRVACPAKPEDRR
jgi:hypothetical protein